MAATIAHTIVHERRGINGPRQVIFKFTDVAQNEFTQPIELSGAKCVWVSVEGVTAAEYYIPSLAAELPANAGTSTNDFDTDDDGGYIKMQASFVSDGTSERAGVGYNVVVPSSSGAGFIGGDSMPPMLSVKVTGADDKDVLIIVNY